MIIWAETLAARTCSSSYRQQRHVGFGDELLVSSAVSRQNSVSIRVSTNYGYDLVTIPRKLA